ncbi:hypothetical protein POM88_040960 [Heracleum sosnowskyi]|uniref:Transposase MuDR plant domain-containing protein n=1 Tax=Heracleum sosnowskyi TaxID=360622 RepID=A0AAD8HFJ7_9APIA|nr:hypothetical protein POM88_040960 [Heracleum sosnowskyi]
MVVSDPQYGMGKVGIIHNPTELAKGMMFDSKDKLMSVVKAVHIANHQEIKVVKSDSVTWEVACKQDDKGCQWRLRARKRKYQTFFEIIYAKSPHTCFNQAISQDHRNLNFSHIAEIISNIIDVDLIVSEKVLMATVGKENINHGTCVDWYFKEYDLRKPILEVARFKRVFWTFKPYIDAFVHCIPVLQIDGTHLYGKYGGVLLTATVVDGFHHLLPVAFAIVEGETIASWTWFMERVRKMVAL